MNVLSIHVYLYHIKLKQDNNIICTVPDHTYQLIIAQHFIIIYLESVVLCKDTVLGLSR